MQSGERGTGKLIDGVHELDDEGAVPVDSTAV